MAPPHTAPDTWFELVPKMAVQAAKASSKLLLAAVKAKVIVCAEFARSSLATAQE